MSKANSRIIDLKPLLDEIGASQIETADMLNPKTFRLSQHPLTDMVERELEKLDEEEDYGEAFRQFLADRGSVEKLDILSTMNADQKLVDMGIIAAARRTIKAEIEKKKGTQNE